jgi:hypothetical protein
MNMMRQSNVMRVMSLFRVLITSNLLSACGSGGNILGITQGSGNVKNETRQVSGISAVQLDTSGELTLSQGDTESLTIEAEDNILPLLTSDISSGTLKLGTKPNTNFSASKPIKYMLVVKSLNTLTDNGSGKITAGDLTVDSPLSITGNGSGNTTIANVQSGAVQLKLSGSGGLSLNSLKSDKIAIDISGSGSAAIPTVTTQSFSARLTGNGALEAGGTTSDQTINISGSGKYDGKSW